MTDKEYIERLIEKKENIFIEASDKIWDNPELYFHETIAAETLKEILKKGEETQTGYNSLDLNLEKQKEEQWEI